MATADIDLTGAIDMHVHSGPDVWPRKLDDFQLARRAAARGMRAIVLKSHWTLTADRAYLVQQVVPGLRVFGGLALNRAVGGLNPVAVEAALRMGAVEIWMPTFSATGQRENPMLPPVPIAVNGALDPALHDIFRLIAEHDAILGTGHLTPDEIALLVPAARAAGVRKLIITHPEHPPVEMPPLMQEELRDRYHVLFERCLITTPFGGGPLPFAALASVIRRVGTASTLVATDFGQVGNPEPPDGLAHYLAQLRAEGFSEQDIVRMSRDNPASLLPL